MTLADPAVDLDVTDDTSSARADAVRTSLDRARRSLRSIDPERALQLLGGILVPLGIIAIVLGWLGASRASYDFQQIPYLISGGLLGLALAVVGGLAYFASWLTRLITHTTMQSQAAIQETGRQAEVIVEAIERLTAMIQTDAVLSRTTPLQPVPAVPAAGLVAAARGRVAHVPSCPAVAGRADLVPVAVDELPPCRLCRPDLEPQAG